MREYVWIFGGKSLDRKRIMKKKVLKYLLIIGLAVLYFIIIYTPSIKMPISWANFVVGITAEPSFIPFDYSKSYMTATRCGRNCNTVKFHYNSTKAEIVVTADEDVSWYNDPKWDKKTKIKGTKYYYREKNGRQHLYWEESKEALELEVEYKGENKLSKSEIVKIANSIKAEER
jgi:hypothetical protein